MRSCLRIPALLLILCSALLFLPHLSQAQVRLGGSSSERLMQQAETDRQAATSVQMIFPRNIDNKMS
ncbi:hypothetical protein A3SI_09627, partial [Nitritalea halalkaliphila LW7]